MKELIKKILYAWIEKKMPLILSREADPSGYVDMKPRKIVVLTGFRRCGKTYIMLKVIEKLLEQRDKEQVIHINFDDERIPRDTAFLSDILPTIKETFSKDVEYLFLDEVQDMPNWGRWVRRIYDNYDISIFITGSSSKVSSREIPTELRGRCIELNIFPLSFKEFLDFKNIVLNQEAALYSESEKVKIVKALDEYIYYGGMPEVVLAPEEKKFDLLMDYYNTVVTRDIIERFNIKNEEALKALLRLLLNSTTYTISKLYNTLKSLGRTVGKGSVAKYVACTESAYFTKSTTVCSPKVKEEMQCPKKVYFIDNGFINLLSTRFSKNLGRLYENAVAIELFRRSGSGTSINYWKDRFGKEVDFVIKHAEEVKQLIQVCYDISHPDTKEREINALIRASDELKCEDLIVITQDCEDEQIIKNKKVRFIPLWKWLAG